MKRLFTSLLVSFIAVYTSIACYSYSKKDFDKDVFILNQCDTIYTGLGHGESEEQARQMAEGQLSNNIFCWVVSRTGTVIENKVKDGDAETNSNTSAKIQTYSQGFFSGLEHLYCEDGDMYYCFCYVGKSHVRHENDKRKELIAKEIKSAIENERQKNITGALSSAYSAQARLNCLSSHPDEIMILNENGIEESALQFTHRFIQKVMNGIKAEIVSQTAIPNQYSVKFTYKDEPVNGIVYEYICNNKGTKAKGEVTAGEGVINLIEGYTGTSVEFRWIYKNPIEGTDIGEMLKLSEVDYRKQNKYTTSLPNATGVEPKPESKPEKFVSKISEGLDNGLKVPLAKTKVYDSMISEIVGCIKGSHNVVDRDNKRKHYAAVKEHFTAEGYDQFMKLIGYGTPSLLHNDLNLHYLNVNGLIYCREVKMSFKVDRYKSFTEDIVFVFENDKIAGVSFAVSTGVAEYISSGNDWSDKVKNIVRNFLEDYRTAYALKDLNYLQDIFSPGALIVIGRKVTKMVNRDGIVRPQKGMETLQLSTEQYLNRLERIFLNNTYINVCFSDYVVKRVFPGHEIYSVQVKQDYFSTHYGDSGYLTLCVDLRDPSKPIVHIRAWQEEADPNWGWLDVFKVSRLISN